MADSLRDTVPITVDDLVSDFLYYNRKEDEELPPGAIDEAIAERLVTVEEITNRFKTRLIEGLQ